jgi:predicted nuclease of predicted toxin-antitoxin system
MLRLAADENFDGRIVRGLFRALPELDLIRVQDTPLLQAEDAAVLEWAAEEGRLVLTHDVGTMTAAAWARVRAGLPMPGLIEVSSDEPLGQVIDEIRLIVAASEPGEYEGQVLFLPM